MQIFNQKVTSPLVQSSSSASGKGKVICWTYVGEDNFTSKIGTNSIENKTLLIPNAAREVYKLMWDCVGIPSDGCHYIELASGIGDAVSMYPEEAREKSIPLDKRFGHILDFSHRFSGQYAIQADMFNLDNVQLPNGARPTSCVGTCGIYYAKDSSELESLFSNLDRFLEFDPATNIKSIFHVFTGQPPTNDSWGVEHDYGQEAYKRMGSEAVKILNRLGYDAKMEKATVQVLVKKRDLTDLQRTKLTSFPRSTNNVFHKEDEGNYMTSNSAVPEDFVLEEFEVNYLQAWKYGN